MFGSAFFTTQYLQSVLGKSALEAALWALLPSVPIGATAPLATALVQKGVNRAYVVTAGFAVAACGYGLLALAGTDSMWLVLVACGVLASGIVMVISQMTDLALGAAPAERAGSASSLLETGSEFGGALGMAVLGSIGTAIYRHDIPASAPSAAHETLGGALAVAEQLPPRAGDALATAAREAFTSGMQGAAIAGALLLAGAGWTAAITLRRIRVGEK
jgi:DHA2 family multidrug resistance protein-like MFS transporter